MPADQDEGQRKLTAILAADVAGYSKLMADDDRETVRTLTAYRQVFSEQIEARQGRIVDTAGDSVLATFESVIEAVEAAVEIQRVLAGRNTALSGHRQMHFRMGVNLGDIIIRDDGTIYGDGVNVAARLEGLAAPGGIMIADVARQTVEGKLAVGLEDAGAHDVKNIAAPVRAWRVLVDGAEAGGSTSAAKTLRRPKVVAGLVAALAVVIGLAVWGLTIRVEAPRMVMADGTPTDDPVLAMPRGPAIAVLPFDNLGENSNEDYFADGLTEEIISGLSRFQNLRVIARHSTLQYRDQGVDIRKVGSDLGVQFVLEGSIRRGGEQLRVATQLLDTQDGSLLWSETYDRTLTIDNVIEVQDDVTASVVDIIGGSFGVIAQSDISKYRGKPTNNLTAYECVLQAYEFLEVLTEVAHGVNRDCLEKAVELDPNYVDAWAWLASRYIEEFVFQFNPRPNAIERALKAADHAVMIDKSSQIAHHMRAYVLFFAKDIEKFSPEANLAISLNPNNSLVLADLGVLVGHAGDWERGGALVEKAMALNPYFPPWYYHPLAIRDYLKADYESALAFSRLGEMKGYHWSYVFMAAANAQLGNQSEAAEAVSVINELYPGFAARARDEFEVWMYPKPEAIEHWIEGLEKAGLFDELEAPSRPVIAVLPFANMSGDAEQEYFAQGLATDISTAFTSFDFRVIASQTVAAVVETPGDISKVISELGADYLVTGSVRRSENALRLAVQLIAGGDGSQIWGQSFDVDLDVASVFELMDEVTTLVTAQIAGEFGAINMERISELGDSGPGTMSSYDCYLKAVAYGMTLSPEDNRAATLCLEKALESDPTYSNGWAELALMYADDVLFGFNAVEDAAKLALEAGRRSVQLDPKNQLGYNALSLAHQANGDKEGFVNAAFKAAELNPNDGSQLAQLGAQLVWAGEYEKGKALIDRGWELNTHYVPWINLGAADYFHQQGDYRTALDYVEKCLAEDPDNPGGLILHISLLGRLGRGAEARASIERLETVWPDIAPAVDAFMGQYFFSNGPKIEKYLEGMREAGFTASDRVN